MKPRSQRIFLDAGFRYKTVFDTIHEDTTGMLYPDFSYYNPTAILKHKVPSSKSKPLQTMKESCLIFLMNWSVYRTIQLDLILNHMSMIDRPDYPYLLSRKY